MSRNDVELEELARVIRTADLDMIKGDIQKFLMVEFFEGNFIDFDLEWTDNTGPYGRCQTRSGVYVHTTSESLLPILNTESMDQCYLYIHGYVSNQGSLRISVEIKGRHRSDGPRDALLAFFSYCLYDKVYKYKDIRSDANSYHVDHEWYRSKIIPKSKVEIELGSDLDPSTCHVEDWEGEDKKVLSRDLGEEIGGLCCTNQFLSGLAIGAFLMWVVG